MNLPSVLVLWAVRAYRRWLSPLLPPACRFTPTCSQYAEEAVAKLGVIRGLMMSLGRLLRCSPLSPPGYDPVPDPPRKVS